MKVNVINLDNKQVGDVVLNPAIYQQPVREDILHKIVEWQRSRRRSGTRKTKGISEISGTTRKPHPQKGTGRARQGSLRSPQMRGGAVIFGPVVRDHGYSMPKKVRSLALKIALSSKMLEQKIVVLDSLNIQVPKTKDLISKLRVMGLNSALFVGFNVERDESFARAYRNVKNIDALPVSAINVYDILNHEHLVLTRESVDFIDAKFAKQDAVEIESEVLVEKVPEVAQTSAKTSSVEEMQGPSAPKKVARKSKKIEGDQ